MFDTVVILAAGRGSRMQSETPKVLLEVAGKPVMQHVIDFWTGQGASNFIFVVGYRKDLVTSYIEQSGLNHYHLVFQPEQKGIANALEQAKDYVPDKFIVALGDFIQIGEFEIPQDLELGYAVWSNPYQKYLNLGCSVRVNYRGFITGITEKADVKYPGIGTYFFDRRVYSYIENAKPSCLRNEVEISDVMDSMIKDGQTIKAIPFYGECINLTTMADITYAEKLLGMGVKV